MKLSELKQLISNIPGDAEVLIREDGDAVPITDVHIHIHVMDEKNNKSPIYSITLR